jgi:hypothetical protein
MCLSILSVGMSLHMIGRRVFFAAFGPGIVLLLSDRALAQFTDYEVSHPLRRGVRILSVTAWGVALYVGLPWWLGSIAVRVIGHHSQQRGD